MPDSLKQSLKETVCDMKKIRYKCLVLDHDDTTVRSTPDVHYPQWRETLETLRPDDEMMSLETFMLYNFNIGFYEMIDSVLHFTPEEKILQDKMWREYTDRHRAGFYEGIAGIIREYKECGGVICVCTHNAAKNILLDYEKEYGGEIKPDMIFDYDFCKSRIKPDPYALNEIMRIYGLKPEEILMLDDMKPGYDMAKKVGVPFAAAGWSHIVPQIREFMQQNCDMYFSSVQEFEKQLFL